MNDTEETVYSRHSRNELTETLVACKKTAQAKDRLGPSSEMGKYLQAPIPNQEDICN